MTRFGRIPIHELAARFRSGSCRCLLLGVCGSGLRSFAAALIDAGHRVSGADLVLTSVVDGDARRAGLPASLELLPWPAVAARMDAAPWDVVIASQALPEHDERLVAAAKRGIPVATLPQAIAAFWSGRRQVSVAGTHGKTTTTALLEHMLRSAGAAPGLFLGGQLAGDLPCGRAGDGDLAVLESCEYRSAFCLLSPTLAVLTGIDRDHFDSFRTEGDEAAAFQSWLQRCRSGGTVIVNADCPRAEQVAGQSGLRVVRVGCSASADWRIQCEHVYAGGSVSRVESAGEGVWRLSTRLPGRHNVLNTVLAAAAARELGVAPAAGIAAAAEFPGVRRRFEFRGCVRGVTLIDDYAHHPTAIAATLGTARQAYPDRRLIVVCEPHQISRLTELRERFVQSLALADECLVLPVLPAREVATRAACLRLSGTIVRQLNSIGRRAFLMANLDQATARIDHAARPGDVVITLGAGGTHCIHDQLTRKLYRDSAA